MPDAALKEDAPKRMTIDEFLRWNPGDDLIYELVDGWPVAQSAPSGPHGRLLMNLGISIGNRLRAQKRPCAPEGGSMLRIDPRWTVRVPDVLIRCGRTSETADRPVLAVEILSPSNSASEMARKRDDYGSVGIREFMEVEQDRPEVRIHRKDRDLWVIETVRDPAAVVMLVSLDMSIPMAEIYQDIPFDEPKEPSPPA